MNKTISKTYTIIIALVGVIAITAIIGRIVYIQYIEGDRWLALAEKIEKRRYKVEAPRGNIYSHDHHLLVTTTPQYLMRFHLKGEYITQNNGKVFFSNLDPLAEELHNIFPNKSVDTFKSKLTSAFQKAKHGGPSTCLLSNTRVTHTQRRQIEQTKMLGDNNYFKSAITWDTLWVRKRPYGNLCKRLLGNTYSNDQCDQNSNKVHFRGTGMNGLENYFDEYLRGQDGLRQVIHAYGSDVALNVIDPKAGFDIITTLDIDIQDIVESELENKLKQLNGEWGTAILMDVKTGGVLACANLGKVADGQYDEINNYATWRVEPGSTMKTMSVMAALESGRAKMSDIVETGESGVYYLECKNCSDREKRITDWSYDSKNSGLGDLTLMEALYASSNIGIAKAIMKAYGNDYDKFVKDLKKLSIYDTRSIELNQLQTPDANIPEDIVTFSRMSYGYFIELPPIYTLRFYNAIANNGVMMKPYLCKAIVNYDEVIKEFEPEIINKKICSDKVLHEIQTALENVVWSEKQVFFKGSNSYGKIATGTNAQSKLVRIAGKTGTAQIFNKQYDKTYHRISFCGYFPIEHPQYSCIVVIHGPDNANAGGSSCAGVVKKIAERTVSLKSRQTISEIISQPDFTAPLPAIKTGYENAMSKVAKKLHLNDHGLKFDKKSNAILSFQHDEQNINCTPQSTANNDKEVPNVVGMGAKDAVYLLEKAGLKVSIHGKGKVISQSIQPGKKTANGTQVNITLR